MSRRNQSITGRPTTDRGHYYGPLRSRDTSGYSERPNPERPTREGGNVFRPATQEPSGQDDKVPTVGDGVTGQSTGSMPTMPEREWWQYLPFFNQSYEDELVQYQNEMDYWRWQQENAYNDAASQVQRYQEAGLNPNLMYEQGSAGSAGSMKPTQTPKYLGKQSMDLLTNAASLMGAGFLAKFQDSAAKLNKQKAITEAAQQGFIGEQTAKVTTERNILDRSADNMVRKVDLQNQVLEQTRDLSKAQKNKLGKDIEKLGEDIKYQKFVNSLADSGLTVHDSVWLRAMYLNMGKAGVLKWLKERIPNVEKYDLRFQTNKN